MDVEIRQIEYVCDVILLFTVNLHAYQSEGEVITEPDDPGMGIFPQHCVRSILLYSCHEPDIPRLKIHEPVKIIIAKVEGEY